jgi:hypothetical protein
MTDDATVAMTRDSGKDSYNSNWTSRLAEFHVEANPQGSTAMSTTKSRLSVLRSITCQNRFLCPDRKPNGRSVNSEPISCHPIDPINPIFPNGPNTQLCVAARTENGKSGGPSSGTTGSAKGSPRHSCPNTFRAARVLGSPTCSRSAKTPMHTKYLLETVRCRTSTLCPICLLFIAHVDVIFWRPMEDLQDE